MALFPIAYFSFVALTNIVLLQSFCCLLLLISVVYGQFRNPIYYSNCFFTFFDFLYSINRLLLRLYWFSLYWACRLFITVSLHFLNLYPGLRINLGQRIASHDHFVTVNLLGQSVLHSFLWWAIRVYCCSTEVQFLIIVRLLQSCLVFRRGWLGRFSCVCCWAV